MKVYFSLVLHVLYESAGALALYCPQLVEPLSSSMLPVAMAAERELGESHTGSYEVTHFTSAHISLAKTSPMAMPTFFLYPQEEW